MKGLTHFYTLEKKERKYIGSIISESAEDAWNIFKKSEHNIYEHTWSNSFFIKNPSIFAKKDTKMIILNK